MLLVRRILVGDQERVLLIRKGRFERILDPGEYWVWGTGLTLETHNVREVQVASPWADYLAKERREIAERYFTIVETSDAQVAVVYVDGKLALTVAPGKRLMFWRGPMAVAAEVIAVKDHPEVAAELLQALMRLGSGVPVTYAAIDEGHTGLLFIENRFVRALSPGLYGFWNAAGSPRVEVVDLRLQTLEIPGQEILTQDKVSIRVNVWAEFQVVDAVKAIGVRVGSIALKDIILPGVMSEILNQVVTAEKQAQANLIRRREETAATRSLANTAKLMEDNPLLVRLKELETLEKVAEKVEKIHVHGGFDTLLQRVITLSDEK
jgi:regulator of protease activity HflC (stomatin/prohibitin superfamily)